MNRAEYIGFPNLYGRLKTNTKKSEKRGSLENYLETLILDVRRKLFEMNRAEYIGFPNLNGRLNTNTVNSESISHFHLSYNCKVHDVLGTPGICHLKMDQIVDCGTFCLCF